MDLQEALTIVKAAGYKVTAPRAAKQKMVDQRRATGCNALGLPLSPLYDPNYKVKNKPPSIARLFAPYGKYMQFVPDPRVGP